MTRRYEHSDDSVVVVIGSGAGGGTLANELAQRGVDVVCLEAGQRLGLGDIVNDPGEMHMKMSWLDPREGAPVWLCKTVGGTTMRWAGVTPRFKDHELRALSTYGQLDDCNLADWPMSPEELAPWYERAEAKMGVSGTNGLPPSFETGNWKVMKAGGRKLGYRDFTTARMAINSTTYDGRPACRQVGFCFSGCKLGAKWSTLYTEIPKAEQTGHFELRAQAMALRMEHEATGKVTGVAYVDGDGRQQHQAARAVAVAGNAVETTRLLRNSSSTMFPDGLGNHSGQLGRNYMRHTASVVIALMPGAVNMHKGARHTGLIRDEHRHDPNRGFAGGYLVQAAAADPASVLTFYPGWGADVSSAMERYDHQAVAWMCGEDPPQHDNIIDLHPTATDAYGLPVPVLNYTMHPNSEAMLAHGNRQARAIFESLGGEVTVATTGSVFGCHNMGVARMSHKPEDGVTNLFGQVHGIPNLFVSDGSLFPTSGAPNPTLTIVALAMRQAEHIAARMSRREL